MSIYLVELDDGSLVSVEASHRAPIFRIKAKVPGAVAVVAQDGRFTVGWHPKPGARIPVGITVDSTARRGSHSDKEIGNAKAS